MSCVLTLAVLLAAPAVECPTQEHYAAQGSRALRLPAGCVCRADRVALTVERYDAIRRWSAGLEAEGVALRADVARLRAALAAQAARAAADLRAAADRLRLVGEVVCPACERDVLRPLAAGVVFGAAIVGAGWMGVEAAR